MRVFFLQSNDEKSFASSPTMREVLSIVLREERLYQQSYDERNFTNSPTMKRILPIVLR